MFFKSAMVYCLPKNWDMTAARLQELLLPQKFVDCTSSELLRQGWFAPRESKPDVLVHEVNKQLLLVLRTEKKLLPASVINQFAKARAAEMEEAQGYKPGKKAMKELKERIADELLPRAFSIKSDVAVWIDPVNGWLVVETGTAAKADEVIKLLLKVIDKMPLESLRVQHSPVGAMTAWLQSDEAPAGFTTDMDAELRATGESKAAVRYVRHTLDPEEIRRHIAAGKQCINLAMTWDSKISFKLTESLAIKMIKPLDVLDEKGGGAKDQDERFDGDFTLMTGELNKMFGDIVESLGGMAKA